MSQPDAPRAPQVPFVWVAHGDERPDEYAWMADRDDPRLTDYLEAENAYTAASTAGSEALAEEIFQEIKARTQETDLSVPVRHGAWWYYTRTVAGQQYSIVGRVPVAASAGRPVVTDGLAPAGEQVVLDENVEAEGTDFFALGASDVSPDERLLAFAVDVTGDERYDLVVREIDTGRVLDTAVTRIGAGVAWSLDGSQLFYTRYDEAWRPYQVWRHRVGGTAADDVLVWEERDETFRVAVGTSRDDRWVVLAVGASRSSEFHLIDASAPSGPLVTVAARQPGVEYDIEPLGDEVFVVHNRERVNFEVARAVVTSGEVRPWRPLAVTAPEELVTSVDAFREFLVVSLRSAGATVLRLVPRDGVSPGGFGEPWDVEFEEPIRTVGIGDNPEVDTHTLLLHYESLVTPPSVLEYDVPTRSVSVLKQTEVLGDFVASNYVQAREWATPPDGTRVPVSVVRRATTPMDGTAPLVVYAYGAYGATIDPYFSVSRLSWLDRGVVYAIAHVRGGEDLGRSWYEDGRMEHKQHTFDDFAAVARSLVSLGYAAPDRVAGKGGSAGGLLIGAVANQAPSVFRALHAQVPFVDVLTTMSDPSLPLTAGEWEEWGNPIADADAYAWIKAYSPYDNVEAGRYPALLVTTNVHDTRVYITEPAKWVARLRDRAGGLPGAAPILLRAWSTAGHGGQSGRYDAWRETAWEMAVLYDLLTR